MIFHNTNGALGVIQLPSGASVPSTALYAEGLAHYATGELYVVPIAGAVPATATYRSGRAITPDGALYVTTQAYQETNAGIPQRLDGAVCVSALGATVAGQFVAPFGYVTSNTLCIAGPQVLVDGNTVADYQQGIGQTDAGGGACSAWANQIGAAGSLTAAGSARPTIQADGSLLFDGVANVLGPITFTLIQPETVYLVVKPIAWTSGVFLTDGGTANTMVIQQAGSTPQIQVYAGSNGGAIGGLTIGAYGTVQAVFSGASSSLAINTAAPTVTNAGANNGGGLTVGASATPGSFSNIQVKEIIVRKVADSAATQAQIQALLKARHGTP